MDNNMKKMMILEHYQNPLNMDITNTEDYLEVNMNTPTCIDNLDYKVKIENNKIKDIKYDGEACAISTSSSSIMSELLVGKTIEEAKNIIDNFEKMINEEEYDKDVLKDANCYDEISKQPNRIKCATMPYEALKKILETSD